MEVAATAIQHADGSKMFRVKQSEGCLVCTTEPPVTGTCGINVELAQWTDFFETKHKPAFDEARRLVMEGRSVFLQGFGGTGRTYAAKLIAKELMEANKSVMCTAYTHMASQNIAMQGATNGTLHHCLHKNPVFRGVVVIGEVSQIPLVLWAAILKWQLSGATFVCLGDFRSQFGPAFNRWRQQPITETMEHAPFFMRLCDHNRINFTTYRRGDNVEFFKLYTGMIGKCVARCTRSVLRQFPCKADIPEWSLTVSNQERRRINKEINEEMHKTRGGVFVDAAHQLDCQGFWLFPGLHVVGCSTDNGLFNGQLYTVLEVAPKVKLQTYGGNDEVTIDMCHIRCIKLAHAITYYSCQGRTLRGRVRLYVQHSKVTTTHLIVGLSRAVCPTLIDCV